jgi:hypothetical protein
MALIPSPAPACACRLVVERMAASTAAAGGGGGTMIQDMPEAMLAYLVFLLAHHPDFPTPEVSCNYVEPSQAASTSHGEAVVLGWPVSFTVPLHAVCWAKALCAPTSPRKPCSCPAASGGVQPGQPRGAAGGVWGGGALCALHRHAAGACPSPLLCGSLAHSACRKKPCVVVVVVVGGGAWLVPPSVCFSARCTIKSCLPSWCLVLGALL